MKLVILQTHPIQYFAPIYRELSDRGNVDVSVIYLTDSGAKEYYDPGFNRMVKWDIDLMTGYHSEVMRPDMELSDRGFLGRNDRKLLSILKTENPDYILLYGYSSLMNWRAWLYAWQTGIKILYTSDSNSRIDIPAGTVKSFIKRILVSTFFSKIYRFLYPGEANAEYLQRYGATEDRLIWSPFAIDVARFTKVGGTRERQYDFVWIGKFVDGKRCHDYLSALLNLKSEGIEFSALLVGDGPCRGEIIKSAKELVDEGSLEMQGFANQSEVPELLSASKTLVFTGENEAYGLMATEAAASGCALLMADSIGSVGQNSSAQPDVNTLVYKVGDVVALTNCMRMYLEDQELVRTMQSASLRIAREHDVDKAAAIIESILRYSGEVE